jgi:hypothetical protein
MARPKSSLRRATPAAALTPSERQVIELMAEDGRSARDAFLVIHPAAKDWPPGKLSSAVASLRKRASPYLRQLVEAGAEQAQIGRATLIEMALQDREFAREHANPGAAVAATKNVAMLAGISMKETADAAATDPVQLLEAVERIVRARNGENAIDITPRSNAK